MVKYVVFFQYLDDKQRFKKYLPVHQFFLPFHFYFCCDFFIVLIGLSLGKEGGRPEK